MGTRLDAVSSLTTRKIAARTPVLLTGGYRTLRQPDHAAQERGVSMPKRGTASVTTTSVGVDWISATLGRDEIEDQTWLHDAFACLWEVQAKGNTYKRRSLLGFDGWESGGCFVGSNDTTHYAQFAGKYANDAYTSLDHPKVHISRVDVQITVQYDIELIKEGRYQYARAIHHNKSLPEHRRRKIHLYAGSDGGDTVYVGSPSSDSRGRVYNKAKQSNEQAYERSWRYEVVLRNENAVQLFRRVISADTEAPKLILSYVLNWYAERGIIVLGVVPGRYDTIAPPKQPATDVERKLRWIKNQVIPTIRKLAELGYAEELMDAIAEAIASARNEQT